MWKTREETEERDGNGGHIHDGLSGVGRQTGVGGSLVMVMEVWRRTPVSFTLCFSLSGGCSLFVQYSSSWQEGMRRPGLYLSTLSFSTCVHVYIQISF